MVLNVIWKVCSECGTEKPASKYYKHPRQPDGLMPRCKACHMGCTQRNERVRVALLERQWGDPSEEQIRAACERLRSGWSKAKLARRRGKASRIVV